MRRAWGDDGAIACCVSPMPVGKQMQFFGARANLAKCLLYAINGGRDESAASRSARRASRSRATARLRRRASRFEKMMDWLAGVYVNAMNVIHYMHDKYAYERVEMALHDYAPLRTMAFGMAGMSVVADSLRRSSTRRCSVIRDETGLVTDYQTEGSFRCSAITTIASISSRPGSCQHVHEQAAQVPDLSQRDPHAVGPDDHVERRVRQGHRQHAGRPPPRRAVRARRESDARPRQPRHSRLRRLGGEDPVSRRCRRISLTATLVPEGLGESRKIASRICAACSTRSSAAPAIT